MESPNVVPLIDSPNVVLIKSHVTWFLYKVTKRGSRIEPPNVVLLWSHVMWFPYKVTKRGSPMESPNVLP